ncbi:hypothetical protein T4E_5784 [Trichinella pseudospiralis]|uniref:Uncharacterized protein n=1 Tax=Trichinella pseudospiralis TaxID=6337 RepID=A0A0V0YJP1_TRIPS|nr:hypothetical protein T4E_5784 [Trichinella pseudospiralis]
MSKLFYHNDVVNHGIGVLSSTQRNLRISIEEHWSVKVAIPSGLLSWIIGKRQNVYEQCSKFRPVLRLYFM